MTAQTQASPSDLKVRAVRTSGVIVVDGDLTEADWDTAAPATHFIQKLPRTGEPATEQTEVRILYDDTNLYLGVYCLDSAGAAGIVVNDITKDFFTLDSDGFQVVLDTFDDNRNCFLFGTNPGAGRFDMQIGADGNAGNSDWDGIWYVRTRITDRGWQIEMAIPFRTLRFRDGLQQIWGINFERRVRRKFEDSYWAPLKPPYRVSRVSLAGTLEGIENIRQGRNLYLKPYVVAPVLRRANDDVDFAPDAGMDLKYGVSSQLTFDATINTDFSQVEADDDQINLTRFSLFFPEKREFFLENASLYAWGRTRRRMEAFRNRRPDLIPFFSRRIGISEGEELVPIYGGARLSGRAGPYTLGLLSMQTARTSELPSTNFSVLRLRRDVLGNGDFGGIFISKLDADGRSNSTIGGDTNLRFFKYLDLNSYWLKTDTPGKSGRDGAANIDLNWRDGLIDVRAGHLWIGENFNPEVGFAPRRGMHKSSGDFTFTPRPKERIRWVREFQPSLEVDYITDPGHVLESRRVEARFGVIFSDSSLLSVARESNFERLRSPFEIRKDRIIPTGDYIFDEYSAIFQTDRSRIISLETRFSSGDFYHGTRDSYGLGVNLQASYRFEARVFLSHNDVKLPVGDFKTNLVSGKLNYSFNTNMFLTALIQYNSDRHDTASNIRFNIIHKPLSDFFLVYNERRASTGEVIERALVAKVTYVWSF
ncbi:MAG: DUF5916 domain-containing protein [Acidobacteriota bacterium]